MACHSRVGQKPIKESALETSGLTESKTETLSVDEFNAENVWGKFNCSEYVIRKCATTNELPQEIFDGGGQTQFDRNYNIKKLHELISDPITCDSVPRIRRLLFDYLTDLGDEGYRVKDLPAVITILEFLVEKVKSVNEYELHLDRMLELCNLPPLLEKTSDSIDSFATMKRYFSLLGCLLAILPTKQKVLKIHKALHSLLLRKSVNIAAVKPDYCCKVMERSSLPITVTKLLQASFPDMYPKILELVFLLTSISYRCSYRMLEAGVLNTLLTRMDLPYATQLRCTRPPDLLLDGTEYSEDTTLLIMNILWTLMKSALLPSKLPNPLKNTVVVAQCALWGLRYTFKRQIYYGQYRSSSVKLRNEIATFILAGFTTFASWNLVSSGIAEDIIELLNGMETGTTLILSEKVKFGRTNEDLYFYKVLLLIAMHLTEVDACIYLMVKGKLVHTVLQIVNPDVKERENPKIKWTLSQFQSLWVYAMNALSVLAPKVPKEFVRYNGVIRLLMILEWSLSTKFDVQIVTNYAKTICSIVLKSDSFLLENFRGHGMTISLIRLIMYILDFKKITMQHQRILTLLLIAAESLMKKQTCYQEMYGEQSIRFILKLLFLCLYQKNGGFRVDQRLLLAIGSYIWGCIVSCPATLSRFIDYSAVYIILDAIEIVPYPAQCLFLAVLTDICDNYFCGSYLCTWRGIDKKSGLMSLLARIWREEEIRIKVKRSMDGSIKEKGVPQMGRKQWLETYTTKLKKGISPALNDMIGSVRSKIYSIRRIIERDNEMYKMAKEHYKILSNDLPIEDRITMTSVDTYFQFKLGQVWTEIAKYFDQVGIVPLGMDSQAIFLMTQRYSSLGRYVKEKQKTLRECVEKAEEMKEKDMYNRICESKLSMALESFDEIDYIRRTTDRTYMLQQKSEQRRQVNCSLYFPAYADIEHCHRTFQDKINVTAVFDQHVLIRSGTVTDSNFGQFKVHPVSPPDSHVSARTKSSTDSHSSARSACPFNLEEFVENS